MKIQAELAKLQIHENLHKNVNENMFLFTFLYKFSSSIMKGNIKAANMSQLSFILLILIYLNLRPSSFRHNFDGPNAFPQIEQAVGSEW